MSFKYHVLFLTVVLSGVVCANAEEDDTPEDFSDLIDVEAEKFFGNDRAEDSGGRRNSNRWKSTGIVLEYKDGENELPEGFFPSHPVEEEEDPTRKPGPGKPLLLTEYIESGKLEEGRKKAKVKPLIKGNVHSYSGFITVNKKFNSNLFFWFFESEFNSSTAPLAVWLQGGPGASSLYGLFAEHGPYIINRNNISSRKTHWSKALNIIYIDNPVGTGFSFCDDPAGLARNQTVVGWDLYNFIVQFLTLFPHLQKNDFFITGESYAGKYVPAFAHRIHEENSKGTNLKVNLKGLAIGNGWSDPINMMKYGDYLYQLGLIDLKVQKQFHHIEAMVVKRIKQKRWKDASNYIGRLIGDDNSTLYGRYTGLSNYYNYYNLKSGLWLDYHDKFINSRLFRLAVHAGNVPFTEGGSVYVGLSEDIPKSVIGWIVKLLDNYPILFYNGQLDIICAYPLTENVLKSMKWKHSSEYKRAKRRIYKLQDEVIGYYKNVGHLTEVVVRDAGHMVPTDQPEWALFMLLDWIYQQIDSQ